MICTLCEAPLTNRKDDYFYKCGICKALVKDRKFYLTSEEEKARYETHNNDVNDIRYQRFTSPITNYVFDNFLPGHKGLDFGSGTGPVISSMLIKKNYNIAQYDPFFANNKNTFDITYDYIVSCEVFEHFHNPKKEIDRLVSILNTNGVLLIMTMLYDDQIDFKDWYYRNDSTHVFIYTKQTMEYIAHENQLKIEVITDRFIVFRKLDTSAL